MEKIKASEVLNRFAYWATDEDGDARIHSRMPSIVGDSWVVEDFNPRLDSVCSIDELTPSPLDWKTSLREIDFSEDFTEERLSLINYISSYLAKELSLRDYYKIKGFFEEMESPDYIKGFIKSGRIGAENQDGRLKIGKIAFCDVLEMKFPVDSESLKEFNFLVIYEDGSKSLTTSESSFTSKGVLKIYEIDQKENVESNMPPHPLMATDEELGKHMSKFIGTQNKSIFQEGDTVHILSYSNQGEFGVSTQGVVKAIKSNSFIAVGIVNGIEELHQEKNISFTPFSIHEAGFSQVRPIKEPKIGDWGFFYNSSKAVKGFYYGKLYSIKEQELETLYIGEGANSYYNFSLEPPVLVEGVPNPFDKC